MWAPWIRSLTRTTPGPRRKPKARFHLPARRPRLDPLEDRTVPATFLVNTTVDTVDANPGDGLARDAAGNTSLRAAVMEANALAGADTIQLPAGTFRLTIAGSGEGAAATGDLDITGDLTILGSVTGVTEISAAGLNDRIFDLPIGQSLTNRRVVTLDSLRLTGGIAAGTGSASLEDHGGALRIDFYNTVTVTNSAFVGNAAMRPAPATGFGLGGAIDNNGFLTVLNTRFDGNQAGNSGGAIYAGGSPAQVTIRRSTFVNNSSRSGGAILNHEPMTIEDSTFANNTAGQPGDSSGQGGAIDNNGGGDLTLTNSTLTGNVSVFGGAVSNEDTIRLINTTIAGNRASFGGGLATSAASATLTNSIIATNTAVTLGPDIDDTVVSQGNNLIGNTAGTGGFVASDLLNVNPRLGPLADNGGPTQTMGLLAGSPAINAANTSLAPPADQRGVARPVGPAADIGAFEGQLANQAPTANDQSVSTNEDTALNGTLTATDPDGNPLTYAVVAGPAHGTVVVNANGTFTYTPAANYNGPDSFTFRANDGTADSNTATVSITVNPVNDPPVPSPASFTIDEDTALRDRVTATDVDGDTLTYSVTPANRPAHAAAFGMQADGRFTYLPAFNYNGPDQFTFTVSDGHGGTATATVSITVNPVNDPPFVDSPTVTTPEDTPVSAAIQYLEAEGEAVTFTLVTRPAHGAVTLNPDGTYTYTPETNFNGTDSFTFRASDPHGATSDGTVTIKVSPVNDAPVAADDAYALDEDGSLTLSVAPSSSFHLEGDPGAWVGNGLTWDYTGANAAFDIRNSSSNGVQVIVNGSEFWLMFFDAAGTNPFVPGLYQDARRFSTATNPGLDVGGNGRGENELVGEFVVYDIAYNTAGNPTSFAASFVQQGQESDGTLDPPIRGRLRVNTTIGAGGGVLANDTDVDADLFTARLVTGPTHGALTFNRDGTFTYTPNANFTGTDTFTYRTNDGRADSNVATVTLTVRPVNDAPVAADGSAATDEDTGLAGSVSATDPDGDALTYSLVSGPAHGTLRLLANGTFTYIPAANYNGTDSFTFKANDGSADSNTAAFALTVRAVNDAPVANNASLATNEDTALTGNVSATDVDGDALTYALVAGPAHGALALGADGSFTYTPAANYNGSDSFTFRANDGAADSNTATVSITVNPVNDPPVANSGSAATNEDTALNGSVTATDIDGDPLTYSLVSGPGHGSLTLNGNGSFTYIPAATYTGPDSFTFKANDGQADSNVATFSITVRAVNHPPVANPASFSTDEDTALSGSVSATDEDGDTLTFSLVTGPAHGTLALNADGSFAYTPAANYNGSDSFAFRASDGSLNSSPATVSITVSAVNDPPVANAGSAATDEDTAFTGTVTATDVDGDPLSYALVSGPAHGTLALNATGSFTYTPAANYNGSDSFTFKANDGTVDSNTATFAITVRPVNDPPVANPASFSTDEDTALSGNVSAADVDGDSLTYTVVTGPAHGALTLAAATGSFTYTPAANYNGSDSFTFRANDGSLNSAPATVSITVNPVNDPPVANSGSAATNEDTALNGNVTATDVDGDPLSYVLVSGPAHGTLALNSSGSFTYTPSANYNGTDSFTFKANDGSADSNTATFSITVRPVNDAPAANNASLTTNEDTALSGSVSATDVDGDTLTYSLVAGPAHGTLTLTAATGAFTYTPAANYNGADSFTFRANDESANSNTATVSITVSAVNDPPVANTGSAAVDEDTALNSTVTATDVDGDPLTYVLVSGPSHGTLALNAGGSFTYTPSANYNGPDSFTFKANEETADSNTATFAITVRPVNDAPVAADASFATDEDTALSGSVSATDVDGDALIYTRVSGPSHGTLTLNANGTFTYTPAANYNGPDSFTFRASDGRLTSNAATVTIAVRAVNDAPTAADDTYTTDQGTALNVPAAGVLANDTDVDGDTLSAAIVSGPANGTVTLNADGSFRYTPAAGFVGTDTFTYKANDGTADSNVATVTVRVALAGNTEGKVTGSGAVDGGRRRFNVSVQSKARPAGKFTLSGSLTFTDLQNHVKLVSTAIRGLRVDSSGTQAVITGSGTVNGRAGYTFTAIVEDVGEPGVGRDTFRIMITGPNGFAYDSIDVTGLPVLTEGNLQVRKKA